MAGQIPRFLFACFSFISLPLAAQQQNTSVQASVEGKTISADGQPLRKTNLTLNPVNAVPPTGGRGGAGGALQRPTAYAATSDANGNFSFTGIEAGRYILQAEHPGYINTTYGTKRTASGGQTGDPLLSLTAGQHLTGIQVELTPQATISGKATDEDGDPMARVQVGALQKTFAMAGARLFPAATAVDG